jgi:hypothetical protein
MDENLQQYIWLAPIAFVGLWCVVVAMVAKASGWSRLAEYYPGDGDFDGEKRHFESMTMGRGGIMSANLNGIVTVGVDGRALRLSVFFPFRFGHAPLTIPLSDLSGEATKLLFFDAVKLQAARAPEIKMTMSVALVRWIEEKSGGLWKAPIAPAQTQAA